MRLWLRNWGDSCSDYYERNWFDATSIDVNVEGGKLAVSFDKKR
jgi:hypothetical protein